MNKLRGDGSLHPSDNYNFTVAVRINTTLYY